MPGDVQHMRRAAVQFRADRRAGGERHHPHVGGVLAGGPDRGQHVTQLPLIIQHRPAAGIGGGDRDHDPQRPRQHPGRCRVRFAVDADQRVQGQRAAPVRPGQGLPRQPGQLCRHGQAEPDRLMRPLRRRQRPAQLAADRFGQERLPQQPGRPAARQLPGWRMVIGLCTRRQPVTPPGPAHLVDRFGQARSAPHRAAQPPRCRVQSAAPDRRSPSAADQADQLAAAAASRRS